MAKQNHAVFARRGCGKTLLLHDSAKRLTPDVRRVYLNCEDLKHHTFPNVLIEILDALFVELDRYFSGWLGKKRRSKQIISRVRKTLAGIKQKADLRHEQVRVTESRGRHEGVGVSAASPDVGGFNLKSGSTVKSEVERSYRQSDEKISELNMWLPELKRHIGELFRLSGGVKAVLIQIDDLYHLKRVDQPFVMDYIHRLCKDLPLYFKIATLRHASVLFAERGGQPTGAQERHDYQSINIDFTLADFKKTETQNRLILDAFGTQAGITKKEIDGVFKGAGWERLVMAGGGVPRDVLSLFLEVLQQVQGRADPRIGKDEVRILSKSALEHRIEELKQDSEGPDQHRLLSGIYAIRAFCMQKGTNVFFVSEQLLQQDSEIRELLYRLLDYRIIHSVGSAITHKSQLGSFHAFMIDIGVYAHMRKLEGRFAEVDITQRDAKEAMRSSPILDGDALEAGLQAAPSNPESALLADDDASLGAGEAPSVLDQPRG
jgi:hypothetical protein